MGFIEIFDKEFKGRLDKERFKCFRKVFQLLEFKEKDYYVILETGTTRNPNNMINEGGSTILFDAFVNYFDGEVYSIDIDRKACEACKVVVSNKVKVINSDSVPFLYEFDKKIDLLYLDSLDLHPHTKHESPLHHMKEFLAAQKNLYEGSIVLVDDSIKEDSAKGLYIDNYMKHIGKERIIDGYQWGWII